MEYLCFLFVDERVRLVRVLGCAPSFVQRGNGNELYPYGPSPQAALQKPTSIYK